MTIEERAIADANRVVGESNDLDKWLSHKIAYERVAKEQQEIDIQRAVEYLCGECTSKCEHICMMCNRKNELIKAMKGE